MIGKVKKGSSLVMVLVFMSIVSIIGISLSGLAVMSYKSRIANSTSRSNLYASEAGIDEVYGVMAGVIDEAVNYANSQVKAIDLEQVKTDKINSLFEKYPNFYDLSNKEYILNEFNKTKNISGSPLELLDVVKLSLHDKGVSNREEVAASIDEERLKNYQNQLFQKEYKNYINKGSGDENGETYKPSLKEALEDSNNYKFTLSSEKSNKPEIKFSNWTTFSIEDGVNNPYSFKIQSKFLDSKLGIIRTIETEYDINVPDYNDVYYMKNVKFTKNIVWEKAIAADGNMDIDGSEVIIDGDVYIKGKDNGGVNLLGINPKLTLKKQLATSQNVNINPKESDDAGDSEFISEGNVYANNVIIHEGDSPLINKSGSKIFSMTKEDTALYLRDDLELNSNKSKVYIAGGFYGLYDGPDNESSISATGNERSSSIAINSDDIGEANGSKLEIKGDVIIQGTAYIETDPEYQTGESISIKGNYKAYTRGLTSASTRNGKSLKNDDVIFEYLQPLSVVTQFSDGENLLAPDKSDYFQAYYKEFKDSTEESDRLITGGVYIDPGKLISTAGAVITSSGDKEGNKVVKSQLSPDETMVRLRTRELKRNIFYMGDSFPSDTEVYNASDVQRDVASLVNYDALNENGKAPSSDEIHENEEIVILDKTNTKYAFIGDGGTLPIDPGYKIYRLKDSKFKGIIAAANDVYFSGKVDFTGTVITKGSIKFQGAGEKKITYDSKLVKKLVADNYKIFENPFADSSNEAMFVYYDDMGKVGTIGTEIVADKIIKRRNWRILK
jgi:hypothetical protein